MSNDISKLSGAHGFTSAQEVKDAMNQNAAVHFGKDSKRSESIFGENGLQAGATKDDFMERFEELGLDEDIASACWELLNIDTEGDSADIIDEEELDKLMAMFGSDAKGQSGDEIDEITLGSLYTNLASPKDASSVDSTDTKTDVDKSETTADEAQTTTEDQSLLGQIFQGVIDGVSNAFKSMFSFTPISILLNTVAPLLNGGLTQSASAETSDSNSSGQGSELESVVTEALVQGGKTILKDILTKGE